MWEIRSNRGLWGVKAVYLSSLCGVVEEGHTYMCLIQSCWGGGGGNALSSLQGCDAVARIVVQGKALDAAVHAVLPRVLPTDGRRSGQNLRHPRRAVGDDPPLLI